MSSFGGLATAATLSHPTQQHTAGKHCAVNWLEAQKMMRWAGLPPSNPRCNAFGRKSRPLASLTHTAVSPDPCRQPANNCPCHKESRTSSRRYSMSAVKASGLHRGVGLRSCKDWHGILERHTQILVQGLPGAGPGMQATYDSRSKGLPQGHSSGVNKCDPCSRC